MTDGWMSEQYVKDVVWGPLRPTGLELIQTLGGGILLNLEGSRVTAADPEELALTPRSRGLRLQFRHGRQLVLELVFTMFVNEILWKYRVETVFCAVIPGKKVVHEAKFRIATGDEVEELKSQVASWKQVDVLPSLAAHIAQEVREVGIGPKGWLPK